VVCKLLNCVRPQTAIFGKKDFQQLFLVQLMVAQLNFPTKIAAMPILREADGLAMSSRNAYLTSDERQRAVLLPNALRTAAAAITAGEKPTTAAATVRQQLQADGFVVDYVECRNATTLTSTASGDIVLLVAATLGQTRLIDNIEIRCPNAAKRELA
jgi:pantoate--beta-alanine ligase